MGARAAAMLFLQANSLDAPFSLSAPATMAADLSVHDMLSQPFDLELINMDTFYRFDQESDLCQAPEDPTSDPSPRSIPSLPRNRKWANTTLESFQSTDKRPANSLDAPFVQHLNTASASATTG